MKFLLTSFILLSGALTSHAFVTLQFSNAYVGGIASGFAGNTGGPKDGMLYGIVVSTANTSFSQGTYDPIPAGVLASGGFLTVGSVTTDDYFFPGGSTIDYSGDFEGDIATLGGSGSIDIVSNVPVNPFPASPITANNPFGLIWFDSSTAESGDYYGFYQDGTFLMPATGTVDMSAPFVGSDPTRNASFQFTAAPEPSRMMLALFGIGLVGLRRRR